ncbi:AAA family ATPase [Bacillus cereus group sp. Bc222]|uniref:ATP-binding protein n=1 Tax=Bacillus cereus group TaxID=86661 RepID=UPI0005C9369F|nr:MULTISPECIES: ATP-binding protein [Bacillus cereus group]KIZ28160.1 hypothetical protein SK30_23995 [Bacillus cereus]MDA2239541.1 AAA family ATPase [Bacillus cereus group sp. Bc222]MDA2586325.1 AAA family ATPase [Bacillus cereus group sp. Bc062]
MIKVFIKKMEINSFRKLKDCTLDLSKTDKLDKNKNMNLTILIGENGTAKTTIFEAIISSFLNEKHACNQECKIEYSYNNCLYYSNMEGSPIPNRVIVSTYTPIDKLEEVEIKRENRHVLYKTSMDRIKLQYIVTRILKHYATGNKLEIDAIFEYIGYGNSNAALEISEYKLKSVSDIVRKALYKIKYNYPNPDYLLNHDNIIEDFDHLIDKYQHDLMIFKSQIEAEIGKKITYRINLEAALKMKSHFMESKTRFDKLLELEVLFVIHKMRILLKLSKELDTMYGKKKRFLSIDAINLYYGGESSFRKDIELLEACSVTFWKDLWIGHGDNRIPLSMLSSGELSLFLRIFDLYDYVEDNSIVLIDEPETHLHPKWIKGYVEILNRLLGTKRCHVIIATHSPLIVSDVPKNSIVALKNSREKIEQVKITERTLGLNYDEILSEVFGLDDDKGNMIHEYAKLIESALENDNFEKALEIYSQMADSNVRYNLYSKLKAYKKRKGEMDV